MRATVEFLSFVQPSGRLACLEISAGAIIEDRPEIFPVHRDRECSREVQGVPPLFAERCSLAMTKITKFVLCKHLPFATHSPKIWPENDSFRLVYEILVNLNISTGNFDRNARFFILKILVEICDFDRIASISLNRFDFE